eukprot:TRINITY_DN12865_c0_g1_i2.p1 TRINITY_DN12865_c0_g1~~TRINITY_DN12865_c0_g1_i2.p1  ORF type:complete len:266 (-),score=45.19 TRINITY_DN12865_c0_g1_i2:6-803(-)
MFPSPNLPPKKKVKIFNTGSLESDTSSEFHANFSNKWIGGGLLHAGGYAQEEMVFALRPECIVVMLLCLSQSGDGQLEDNEAIIISGSECFSDHEGYGPAFKYLGNLIEKRKYYDHTDSVAINIVCVDALTKIGQYEEKNIHRELCKLYSGIYNWREKTREREQIYATSHWGCGTNGGDRQLKAIEQLVALSEAGLDIHYYTYGASNFSQSFENLINFLTENHVTVGEVASALFSYGTRKFISGKPKLFEHVQEQISQKRGLFRS